ncbi:50S ribosomal protein L9 [Corynebacterium sp. 320]|uniref:Large ribosomal subunit protein bL9 n=1 Tax=Corynebacterium zhongnanshanii TaxID=2768834 RepID=A0ABQ6VBS5_9CORY|nr:MULTISPECIES: 50S ribosomal protein L9 [Corynebacterium]KAB1502771.1 50S ribosomal protein L9 [Corynebacterium sp. 320]KAB1550488.1 50S ribosomal protein L9 [Corynebacterium sp. 319]KAB1554781.1 50S ribosomal protein L9 [Corynebacterium sp. 321]KAB3519208.1 50S ribosomal protein L9 [Corynebacterium zhongnanshanii]KAB3526434.1 50S ribosomal protein L9 [Corynebacterium sp. 250]
MKLILTAAVDNLGVPGDIVEVKAGYGRNYLLPRGYAILATRGAEKQIEGIKRAQEARKIRDLDHAREVKEELEALTGVTIAVRTSDAGKLFGSVSADDIVAAVKKANGRSLDKHSIALSKGQVKTTGNYAVDVKLHSDIVASLNFEVVAA